LYHVYYPEDPAKEPTGVVFHQGKFHKFFHLEMTGNPYLGAEHKEVNQYELFEDDATTEGSTKEQLALQIYNSLVIIDKDQLGSPERTQEPWGPDSMSLDLAVKHTSMNIFPENLQWESTGTMPIANAPTVEGYTTHLLNAQSLSRKCLIMRRASRQLLSRYLQSLKRAHPPLADIQSM
jgi:hypothetical protein